MTQTQISEFNGQASTTKLVAIGLCSGLFGGLFGLGGGVIIIPLLVLWVGFNQRQASATSTIALIPTALIGLITYAMHGQIDLLAGLALIIGITIGAQIGVKLLTRLSLRTLEWCFFAFLLVAAVMLWLVVPDRSATLNMTPLVFIALILFALIPGLLTGLLGLGGGVIAIPVLITGFGVSDVVAKGTSLLMAVTGVATAALKTSRKGLANYRAAVIIGVAGAVTAPFGVWLALLVSPKLGNILFSAFLLVIATQYFIRLVRSK